MSEELTESEKQEIKELLGYGSSTSEGKHNTHSFLYNVATAQDTTRLGNLTDEEIGKLDNPIRAYKFLALFADKIMKKDGLKDFFNSRSGIGTDTSLSRQGFLTKLAVVTRKELADVSPKDKKKNKSWFKSKDEKQETQEQT